MENEKLNYINSEFGLSIIKKKGKMNTVQMYKFKENFEILICIATMTEQLIKEEDIIEAVEMGAKKANESI